MTERMAFPKIDLTTFFLSISSAAFMNMGLKLGPEGAETGKGEINLNLARQNIDLLELMEEKTKGNRSADEDLLLQHLLFETRMRFVEAQKQIAEKKQ